MPVPNPFLQAEVLQFQGSPLAPAPIRLRRQANEGYYPEIPLTISNAALPGAGYSAGVAVTASTPGRQVYPTGLPDFDSSRRSFAFVLHQHMPPGLRLIMGRTPAIGNLAAASANPMDTVAFALAPTEEGYQNGARATILEPFYLFDDSTAENTGVLHLQITKNADLPVYSAALDHGNAGRAVIAMMVPVTEGAASGRATEAGEELAGDGPAWVLMRPAFDESTTPENPNPNNAGVDDTITPSFRQVGSLVSAKEVNKLFETAQTRKNYNNDIIDESISQNLIDVNFQGSSKNLFLRSLMSGGIISDLNGAFRQSVATPNLQRQEAIVLATNSKGFTYAWHIPRAVVKPNGAETVGARGESVIPAMLSSHVAPIDLVGNSLYQMLTFTVTFNVTA